jgi:hypothetical protein
MSTLKREWVTCPAAGSLPADCVRFKLLTWNVFVWHGEPCAEWTARDLSWATRLPAILAELAAHDADVVLLQEVTRQAFRDLRAWFDQRGFSAHCGDETFEGADAAAGANAGTTTVEADDGTLAVATFVRRSVFVLAPGHLYTGGADAPPPQAVPSSSTAAAAAVAAASSSYGSDSDSDADDAAEPTAAAQAGDRDPAAHSRHAHHHAPHRHAYDLAGAVARCDGSLRVSVRDLVADWALRRCVEGRPVDPDKGGWDRERGHEALAAASHDWFWGRAVPFLPRASLLTLLRSVAHPSSFSSSVAVAVLNDHAWGGTGFAWRHGRAHLRELPTLAVHATLLSHALLAGMAEAAACPGAERGGAAPGAGGGGGGGSTPPPPPLLSSSSSLLPPVRVAGVLAGDFNANRYSRRRAPGERGGVYQLLTTGALPRAHPEHPCRHVDEVDGDTGLPVCVAPASVQDLRSPLVYASAYAQPGMYDAPWPGHGHDAP